MDASTFDRPEQPRPFFAIATAKAPGAIGAAGGIEPSRECVKPARHQAVVPPVSHPISLLGGAVGLEGSTAPVGATVEVATMTEANDFARIRREPAAGKPAARAESPKTHTRENVSALRLYADRLGKAAVGAAACAGGKAYIAD